MHGPDSKPDDQLERRDMRLSTDLPNGQEETSKFTATHNQDTAGIIYYFYDNRSYTIRLLSRTKKAFLVVFKT